MGSEVVTEEIPRIIGESGAPAVARFPHELLFETAMARLDAVTSSWQETLAGFAGGTAAGRHAAPHDSSDEGPDEGPDSAPLPIGDEAAAVVARAEAPRWRRRLAA